MSGLGRNLAREVAAPRAHLGHVRRARKKRNTQAARALYERIAFRSIGTIPSAMRVNGVDVDEEFMVLSL